MTTSYPPHGRGLAELISLRLVPGDDLRGALEVLVRERAMAAAWVASAIGSLQGLVVRPAGSDRALQLAGPWELLSLQGSLGSGGVHLHLTAADAEGHCRGGHLLAGNVIRTTAEIALLLPGAVRFERQLDPATGYRELLFEAAA
ncbi:PPC domain-containing DNA-binding protein [Cyanobium sp. Morenito 9A2]|uniref:PPC domain-containing DNA-binding protein n=1 Tax=Cyanobium sp. Morenito 9A2 TaxID=2823718 RepID=UPI0020CF392C|nr:PPC domain-containing DNA-binding protein [Cyanobium sp. Morenito 9A2]MCP9850041.1 DNA-binding protein [Cyanobium sp. Morenito 9A2]